MLQEKSQNNWNKFVKYLQDDFPFLLEKDHIFSSKEIDKVTGKLADVFLEISVNDQKEFHEFCETLCHKFSENMVEKNDKFNERF